MADPAASNVFAFPQPLPTGGWPAALDTSVDDSPDDAGRAQELSEVTGGNPGAIHEQLEPYERNVKQNLAYGIVSQDPWLQKYIESHPLAAKISNDDWGNLSTLSDAITKFGEGISQVPVVKQIQAGIQGFREGFGDEPVGSSVNQEEINQFVKQYPALSFLAGPAIMARMGSEIGGRASMGVMGAGHAGLVAIAKTFGATDQTAEQFARNILGVAESEMARTMGEAGGIGNMEAYNAQVHEVMRAAEPYVSAGKIIPVGAHPLVDEVHKQQVELDMKGLDEANKAANSTNTLQRPGGRTILEQGLEQHPAIAGRMIGISLEGIDKIYPEGKVPEPGDGILGDVPGIAQQIELARSTGGDVEVPLKSMVTADPDAYKELHDFIRPRPGGMTLDEAKEHEPSVVATPIQTPIDAIRTASALEPDRYRKILEEIPGWSKAETEPEKITGKDLIPHDVAKPDVMKEKDSGQVYPSVSMKYRDILKNVDFSELPPHEKVISDYFGKVLSDLVGDIPVHVISRETISDIFGRDTIRGFWDPDYKHIAFREDVTTGVGDTAHNQSRTVLHEGIHAVTAAAIEANKPLKEIIERLRRTTYDYLSADRVDLYANAFKNEHEFITDALTKPGFRRLLSGIRLDPRDAKALRMDEKTHSVWDSVQLILKRLWASVTGKAVSHSVFDGVIRLMDVIEEMNQRGVEGATERQHEEEPVTPGSIGISKKEQSAYLAAIARENEGDLAYQRRIAERDERLRQTAEWKENESKVRDTVTTELHNRPDIAADRFLREGKLFEGKVERQRLRADRLSDEQKSVLSPEHYAARGLDPDFVAGLFGYHNGGALVNSLSALEHERQTEALTPADHFRKLRDVEVEKRMKAQFGDLEQNILAEAKEHVLSPTTMDRLIQEHLQIGMQAGQAPITKEAVKAYVREQAGKQIVSSLDSDALLATVGRTGREIEKAFLAEKFTDAYKLSQFRVIQAHLAREAVKYEKERASSDRLLKRTEKRDISGVAPDWANWIHYLMFKGGEAPKRTPADLQERMGKFAEKSFSDFIDSKQYPKEYAPEMFDDAKRWNSQDEMTLDEWRGWAGSIKTLYNYARSDQKYLLGRDLEDLNEFKQKLKDQMKEEAFSNKPSTGYHTKLGKLWGDAQSIAYKLVWMNSIWHRLDHGDRYGLFQRAFGYPAQEGAGQYSSWVREFSQDVAGLAKYDTNLKQKVDSIFHDPEFGRLIPMDKEMVRQAILYLGTRSGENKLIRGWMLPKGFQPEEYELARQQLYSWLEKNSDKKDWDFAKAYWAINERIFDKYENMVTNVGGVPAQRETLNPIQIHGQVYPGGYTKLIYDERYPGESKALMGLSYDPDDALGNTTFYRASTPKSHEKQRTGYAAPLYLRLDRNNAAMSNVLRDAAIRPFIIQATKIFYDKSFRAHTKEYLGEGVDAMLTPYLESMAGMGTKLSRDDVSWDRLINYLTTNTVARLIGWNIHTLEKHTFSAAANSLGEVGLAQFSSAVSNLRTKGDLGSMLGYGDDVTNWQAALRFSNELPNRMKTAYESMGGQWDRIRGKVGLKQFGDWMKEKGTAPIGFFDLASAVPTWIAAFKRSIEEQGGEPDLGLAREVADNAVIRAHGSTSNAIIPSARRGRALERSFTRLFSFFNAMWQRNYETFWRTKAMVKKFKEGDFEQGKIDGRAAMKMLVFGNVIPALVEEMITPYPSGENDSWATWASKMLLYSTSGMIPGLRELVHAAVGGFDVSSGVLGTMYRDAMSLMDDVKHGSAALDADRGGKTLRDANAVFGTVTPWTNDQVGRTLKWGWDVSHESRETPRNLTEHWDDLTKGHPRETHR